MNKQFLETIKVVDGVALHLEYHQQRLNKTLKSNNVYQLKDLIDSSPLKGLYKCRIVYDLDNIDIEYISYTKRSIKYLKILQSDTIVYDKKYANREAIDSLYANREDADDIIVIKNGLVTDTSIANIAFYDNGVWFTPKEPLLKGTCRARLLDEGKLIEEDIRVNDIKNFSKIALMNAMTDLDIIASENIEDIIC